jgi:hypothetical protein
MSAKPKNSELTAEQVRDYLKSHPEFLNELPAPERDLCEGVVDFQHFMLKNLQKDSKSLKERYELLVDYCRDNLAAQAQVHQAALKLIQARGLEQLLEVLALDFVSLFDVDVVRLAMESDAPMDTSYGEEDYSGIVFIEQGTIDLLFGNSKKNVMLIGDAQKHTPIGFDDIFTDCEEMIASCALLRLLPDSVGKHILLAFGVRHKDRYHDGQGVELLSFLAEVVAHQLDKYLDDLTL